MSEWSSGRKTGMIVGIALVVIALVAFLSLRPAVIFGVDGSSLAHSLGGGDGPLRAGESDCDRESGEQMWRCTIYDGGSGSSIYAVRTQGSGCWEAWNGDRPIAGRQPNDSGCIHLLDIVLRN